MHAEHSHAAVNYLHPVLAEIMDRAGEYNELKLRRCLRNSRMLSSDVNAGFDPLYASAFEKKNASYTPQSITSIPYRDKMYAIVPPPPTSTLPSSAVW